MPCSSYASGANRTRQDLRRPRTAGVAEVAKTSAVPARKSGDFRYSKMGTASRKYHRIVLVLHGLHRSRQWIIGREPLALAQTSVFLRREPPKTPVDHENTHTQTLA